MPIYKGKEFIERIYKGKGDPLRRVEKGKDLTYGLFDIYYHDRENMYDAASDNEITQYAWGKNRLMPPSDGNNKFEDYFDEYKTHWYGWWDDPDYDRERSKLDDRYCVAYNDRSNLQEYAKWAQLKYTYSGHYSIFEEKHLDWDPDGGSSQTYPAIPGATVRESNNPLISWPVPGFTGISSGFGWRTLYGEPNYHKGIDISGGGINGHAIVSAASGVVDYAGYNEGGYGNYVKISGNGFTIIYGHMLNTPSVRTGQSVSQGDTIGYVGSTGNSTGPHLHFEVYQNGELTDPMNFFSKG